MGLALRTINRKPNDVVKLGRTREGVFIENSSTNREFKSKGFLLADSECDFYSPSTVIKESFYTDVYGNENVNVRHIIHAQFVRPEFRLEVHGIFETYVMVCINTERRDSCAT